MERRVRRQYGIKRKILNLNLFYKLNLHNKCTQITTFLLYCSLLFFGLQQLVHADDELLRVTPQHHATF